ncbi:MAG: DUF4126 domain-containing protein, partial [Acidobacteriota bacterium]|nr:DUF4126 domain-containing protein [Acidobacteriota bacterium]
RLITHASPEPETNSVFSLAEDFGVVGLVLLVYKHPQVAIGVAIALLVLMALIAPFLFRAIVFLCSGIAARIRSLFAKPDRDNVIPAWLQRELKPDSGAWRTEYCFARSVPGVSRLKRGYLAVSDRQTVFVSKGVLGAKMVPLAQVELQRGLIFDLIAARAGERPATMYLTKDRAESFRPIALATS